MASVMSCSSLHAEIESHDLGFCMDIGNIGFFFCKPRSKRKSLGIL